GVGAQRRPHAGHLVGGDGGTGARPATEDGGVGLALRHQLPHPPADVGPAQLLTARRPDKDDLVAPAAEVLDKGVGEARPLVTAECDPHVGYRNRPYGRAQGLDDGAGRRGGEASRPPHRRPGETGGALRRALPHRRLRPVEHGQRRLPPHRRADPVQEPQPRPPRHPNVAALDAARLLRDPGAGPDAAGPRWFAGSADAIYQNLNLVHDEGPDYILVFGADHI